MIKTRIGTNAGRIWRQVNSTAQKSCSFDELRRELELSEQDVNLAIGWLSREGQIVIDEKVERVSIPICPYF
jgi:biotin operon repressor